MGYSWTTACRKIEKKKDKNRDWPTKIIGKIEQKNAPPSQATHPHSITKKLFITKVKIIFKHKYI